MSIMGMGETFTEVGSRLATIMFLYTMLEQYFPDRLRKYIKKYVDKLFGHKNHFVEISIQEYPGEYSRRSSAYIAIEAYLSTKSPQDAMKLKAQIGKNKKVVYTMDDNESIVDKFEGATLFWSISTTNQQTGSGGSSTIADEKRSFVLNFHVKYRHIVTGLYMDQVIEQGKALLRGARQRKLYSNNSDNDSFRSSRGLWSHVVLDHPATFDNLAMDPIKKKEIVEDLIAFTQGKDYYARVGKAWKRGYLLYGPPGTGKSTMVAAIANFLNYDIYDLELSSVKANSELRKLLLDTSNRSVIVIEDIDCTISLTTNRRNKMSGEDDQMEDEELDEIEKRNGKKGVTLSGLLNFIDGLWSSCGRERLIVFTTNYVERLDPALIRRGRMDMHIEMSYICFEGFKVLAKNYLNLDSHILFDKIRCLIRDTKITPADVAENLMPKNINEDQTETCLKKLIQVLEKRKEDATLKAGEKEKKRNEDSEETGSPTIHRETEAKEILSENKEENEE